jgi:murein DD-endopeptidase
VPRVLFSLLVFGSLGATAITLSSLLPAGPAPAAEWREASLASISGPDNHMLSTLSDCIQNEPLCTDFSRIELTPKGPAHSFHHEIRQALQDPAEAVPGHGDGPDLGLEVAATPPPAVMELALDIDGDGAIWPATEWLTHTLREGEHLAALWNNSWGLRLRTLYQLGADPENARLLDIVHPGQEIEWQVDPDGDLKRLRLWIDGGRGHEWVRLEGTNQYTRMEISNEREISHRLLLGQISGTLAESLETNAGLAPASARAIGSLLEDHLPVGTEVRQGDEYTLLVEIETLAGSDTPYDFRLLAFAFVGATKILTAARHADGRFYTPEGQPLLPFFDRRPFKGDFRITSGYNKGRRHPITGRVAPHNGTDFSMPVGTPILAPADGRVAQVDSHPLAGRLLVIEHGQGFSTRYLHLQKALVQPGQQVKRGERIALSGNSGRTTSAHLHYELHMNGRPVDLMRVELPRGEPLSGSELVLFQRTAQPLLAQLREAATSRQVAMQPMSGTGF